MKMKASFAALVSLLALTGASRQSEPWPGSWCSEDGPRQLPVVVMVTPVKTVFEAGEPLIVRVTITNNLRAEIGFSTYATEMKDWNGEVWNMSMVEIARRGGGLTLSGSYRPVVTPPIVISGLGRQRVAPGQTLTITTNLRKWDIGGWDSGEYAFRFAVSGISIDDNTTATIRAPCARFSIQR